MKGYIVAIYEKIDDDKILKKYAEKAGIAVKKYSGKILVRGGKSECIEGLPSPRTVILEFLSIDNAKKFYYSKEYQEAKKILGDAAKRNYQIIEGV